MKLLTLGCTSSGNCHILTDSEGNSIILDCGLRFVDIITNLTDLNKVSCTLVTHGHIDHIKSLSDFQKSGVLCYTPENCKVGELIEADAFKILPFPCCHSVTCYGYIIYSKAENCYCLYATDSTTLSPKIADREFQIALLECNWDIGSVSDLITTDKLGNSEFKNHMELSVLETWLKNRKHKPKRLILTHLSQENSSRERIKQTLTQYCEQLHFAEKNKIIIS